MRKALVIDNGTIHIGEIKSLLKDFQITTIPFAKADKSYVQDYDLLILTGSSSYPLVGHQSQFANEIEIIKTLDIPIIGICLGFELISYAYGAELLHVNKKIQGINVIRPIVKDFLFSGISDFEVYEGHRWLVKEVPPSIEGIAESNDGIEVIRHKRENKYGFQFHPEVLIDKTCGKEIFGNLLRHLELI